MLKDLSIKNYLVLLTACDYFFAVYQKFGRSVAEGWNPVLLGRLYICLILVYHSKYSLVSAMFKAFKYRIYPTTEQRDLLIKSFGCYRWFYNYSLNLTTETYKKTGKGLSRNEIIKLLPQLKKEHEWLTEPPSQVLQQVADNLSPFFSQFL